MRGELEQVFEALNGAGVRYVVVGGVAVVLHGHLRTTQDLDLVVQLEAKNVRETLAVLATLGFQPRAPVPLLSFADPETRARWVREKNLVVFSLWSRDLPGFTVDLFAEEPFDFDEVYKRSLRVPFDRTTATVIGLSDLIHLKRKSSRPLDLDDVQALLSLESGKAPKDIQGESTEEKGPEVVREFPDPWEEQRREQVRYGLEFSPADRLRWLEETMETMRRWCGRAKLGRPIGRADSAED